MSRLRELLEELQARAEVESVGAFSLDADKARDKLRQYRLADPYWYILLLVQSAVARGASMIEIETDGKRYLRMRFFADPLGARELRERNSALFVAHHVQRDVGALQDLAIGLDAALGLRPTSVEVRSGAVRALLRPGRDDEVEGPETQEVGEGGSSGESRLNEIIIRHGGFFGFGEDQVAPALALLRARAQYCRARISVDGEAVSHGLRIPAGSLPQHRFHLPHTSGVMAFPVDANGVEQLAESRLRVLRHGVWLADHEVSLPRGLDVLVDCGVLRKDVSQQDVNRDEVYRALVADLLDESARFAAQLVAEMSGRAGAAEAGARRWLRRAVPAVLPRPIHAQLGEHRPELRTLMDEKLWPTTVRGEMVSPRGLLQLGTPILHGTSGQVIEGATVLQVDEHEAALIGEMLGREVSSVRARAAKESRRARARERFESRWHPARLPQAPWRVRRAFDGPGGAGEIGIHRLRTESRLAVIREGRLLTERSTGLELPGLVVMLEGDFTPTEGYDGVLADERWAEGLVCLIDAVDAVVSRLAESLLEKDGLQGDHDHDVLLSWLRQRTEPGAMTRLAAVHGLRAGSGLERFERLVGEREGLEAGHPVRRVPLFVDSVGGKHSLDELARSECPVRAGDEVRCVAPETSVPRGAGPFLRVDPTARKTLTHCLDDTSVVMVDATLRRERARAEFEARVEPTCLDPGMADPWLGLVRQPVDSPWAGRIGVRFDDAETGLGGVAILEPRRVDRPTLAAYVTEGLEPDEDGAPRGRRIHDEVLPVGSTGLVIAVAGVRASRDYGGIAVAERDRCVAAALVGAITLLEEIERAAPARFREDVGLLELLLWVRSSESLAPRAEALLGRIGAGSVEVSALGAVPLDATASPDDLELPDEAVDLDLLGGAEGEDARAELGGGSGEPPLLTLLAIEDEEAEEAEEAEEDEEAEQDEVAEQAPLPPAFVYPGEHPLTILLEAVREQLRAARRHNPDVLGEAMLDRLGTIVSTGESPLRIDGHDVLLDGAHPLMRRAVGHSDDLTTVAVVASMAFSALTRVRPRATEVHESVFHTVHARVLLDAQPGGSSSPQ